MMDNISKLSENLKDVPQSRLVQYARDPNSVVPQFLALAELQRRKRLESAAGAAMPQSTVAQDIMASTSQMPMGGIGALAPRQGVASLPTGMAEDSFAGGGIVAFAEGEEVEDPYADLTLDEKLKMLRTGRRAEREPSMFSRGLEAIKGFPQRLTSLGRPPVPPAMAGVYGGDVDMQPGYTPSKAIPVPPAPNMEPPKPTATKPSKALPSPEVTEEPKKRLFEDYETLLKAQGEESKKDKEESKYMRLLEAGFGIMGGTSPYALTNIGAGAMGAVKGAAADVAQQRKEERERLKDMAALGMKREEFAIDREKLGILDRRYKEMADIERQKIGVMSQQNVDAKTNAAVNNAFSTMMGFYKNRIDAGEISPSEVYAEAQRFVMSNKGGVPVAGPQASTISWSSLGKK